MLATVLDRIVRSACRLISDVKIGLSIRLRCCSTRMANRCCTCMFAAQLEIRCCGVTFPRNAFVQNLRGLIDHWVRSNLKQNHWVGTLGRPLECVLFLAARALTICHLRSCSSDQDR